jgi:hypothetical protein
MPNCEVTVTVQLRACTCTLAADFGGTSIELACERVGGLILRPPVSAGHNLGIPKFAQDG